MKPSDLPIAAQTLAGSSVRLSTVIGFPHGSNRTDVKVFEAERAMDDGAVELDMVLNIGRLIPATTTWSWRMCIRLLRQPTGGAPS